MIDVSAIDDMNEREELKAFATFTNDLANDRGEAASSHLAAGRAIYFVDDRYGDAIVKQYPDGRRQIVDFTDDREIVIRDL